MFPYIEECDVVGLRHLLKLTHLETTPFRRQVGGQHLEVTRLQNSTHSAHRRWHVALNVRGECPTPGQLMVGSAHTLT